MVGKDVQTIPMVRTQNELSRLSPGGRESAGSTVGEMRNQVRLLSRVPATLVSTCTKSPCFPSTRYPGNPHAQNYIESALSKVELYKNILVRLVERKLPREW
jgi:hypothetical protein